jgi:hypothetical protein
MQMWEYPDGSEVRYKPLGGNNRPNKLTFSIEVKKNPASLDSGIDDVAFKIDRHGAAAPKRDFELRNPFEDAAMQEVHVELKP